MTSTTPDLPEPGNCPHCATPATSGARFCRACGRAIDAPEPEPAVRVGVPDAETTGELDRVTHVGAEVAAPTGSLALRSCPSCGGPNSPNRELCGRCGADLDTGTVPPRADARALAFPEKPGSESDEPRSWLGAALAVLVVALLVVGGLGLAGVGPFGGSDASVPSARFDAQVYGDAPQRLPIAEIATLTTRGTEDGTSFEASQMVDDDPTTAWNSDGAAGGPEDGVGERIELVLEEPGWVDRIVIRNGDQRDPDTYAANARIQRAQVTMDGGVVLLLNLLDEGLAPQAVELTEPVLTTGVAIEILDTFAGDTHPDLGVSDLELQGWTAAGDDVQLARQRAQGRPATASPDA